MGKRFLSGFFLIIFVILAFLLRSLNLYFFDIIAGIIAVFSAYESAKLNKKAGRYNYSLIGACYPALSYILILVGVLNNFTLINHLVGQLVLLVGSAFLLFGIQCFFWNKMIIEKKIIKYEGSVLSLIFKKTLDTAINFVYPTLLLIVFVIMNHIGTYSDLTSIVTNFKDVDLALIVILATVITACFSDLFALFVGTIIGGKKLAPKISPNKTIAGSIGGFVGSILSAAIFFIIVNSFADIAAGFAATNVTVWTFIIYGFLASLFSQAGDLFESYLKRIAKAKDSGNLFPGHGGIMDRLDSVSFNLLFSLVFFIIVL